MHKVKITPKQAEVLHYLSDGLQNKQIAYKMGVTVATVKLHLLGLYQRLSVNSRMCALIQAQKLGLIPVHKPEPPTDGEAGTVVPQTDSSAAQSADSDSEAVSSD